MLRRLFLAASLLLNYSLLSAAPRADIHLHYKENQAEITSVEQALAALDEEGVELAVVIGTPPDLALKLREADPQRVLLWYGVYHQHGDWSSWYHDLSLLERAREAILSGDYYGVGELHLIGGFAPRWNTPVIKGLLALSAETGAPLLIHVEFGRADYLIGLCQQEPEARLLLAHAGAPLRPAEVKRALDQCPNLWWELSARDPLRYTGVPIVDESGTLKPAWKTLIMQYSDRLMVGSDPVWPVEQLNPWDEPDTGWQHLGTFWAGHEAWLSQLPEAVAEAIRVGNARTYFSRSMLKPSK